MTTKKEKKEQQKLIVFLLENSTFTGKDEAVETEFKRRCFTGVSNPLEQYELENSRKLGVQLTVFKFGFVLHIVQGWGSKPSFSVCKLDLPGGLHSDNFQFFNVDTIKDSEFFAACEAHQEQQTMLQNLGPMIAETSEKPKRVRL